MKKLLDLGLTGACAVLCAWMAGTTPAAATIFDYTISGSGSGSLGGTPFTNQAFTITMVGDNSTVMIPILHPNIRVINPLISADVNLGGLGDATLSGASAFGLNTINNAIFFQASY